ncbi:MAG TPA: hydrogenase maturation nickel metallochaperone HypA [Candidatus Kryptonia bacterium]
MHELSIAENIVNIVRENVDGNASGKVKVVRVKVGELAGVIPESLEFCFNAIIGGTPLEGARLFLERTRLTARCSSCGKDSEIRDFTFLCAACGSTDLEVITGDELQVMEIEVENDWGKSL